MPKLKFTFALAALCGLAAAQTPVDGPGVAVDLGDARVLHRTPVTYPASARGQHAEGTVVLELALDDTGNVSDARVLSGPLELRKAAILSVLQWHFTKDAAATTRQVRITFKMPAEAATPEPRTVVPAMRGTNPLDGRRVTRINIVGIPDEARNDLLSRLPMHEGDLYSSDMMNKAIDTARQFDEHLSIGLRGDSNNGVALQIFATGSAAEGFATSGIPRRIRIGGNVQQAKLISQQRPVYPPDAKAARVQDTVSLEALIAADGHVANLTLLRGHPLLVQSAMDAVNQWVYQPTLLNGVPVEVTTQIDVNYTLSQ